MHGSGVQLEVRAVEGLQLCGRFSRKNAVAERSKKKAYPKYATGSKVQVVNAETTEESDITEFDEEDDVEFTQKCLLCMGLIFFFL